MNQAAKQTMDTAIALLKVRRETEEAINSGVAEALKVPIRNIIMRRVSSEHLDFNLGGIFLGMDEEFSPEIRCLIRDEDIDRVLSLLEADHVIAREPEKGLIWYRVRSIAIWDSAATG